MDSKWTKEQIFNDEDSKNKEFGTCYIIKKSKIKISNKKSKLFGFICFVFAICIAYFIYNISSNLVSVSQQNESQVVINAKEYYAVSLVDYTNDEVAYQIAQDSKNLGGAGYVYNLQDRFYILVSVYEKEAEARNVKDKLVENNYKKASVVTLQAEEEKYLKSYINSAGFKQSLNIFEDSFKLYLNLYKKYDQNQISYTEAKRDILSLFNHYSNVVNEVVQSSNKFSDDRLKKLVIAEQNTLALLNSSSDIFVKEDNFSSNLKYACIQTIINRTSL